MGPRPLNRASSPDQLPGRDPEDNEARWAVTRVTIADTCARPATASTPNHRKDRRRYPEPADLPPAADICLPANGPRPARVWWTGAEAPVMMLCRQFSVGSQRYFCGVGSVGCERLHWNKDRTGQIWSDFGRFTSDPADFDRSAGAGQRRRFYFRRVRAEAGKQRTFAAFLVYEDLASRDLPFGHFYELSGTNGDSAACSDGGNPLVPSPG